MCFLETTEKRWQGILLTDHIKPAACPGWDREDRVAHPSPHLFGIAPRTRYPSRRTEGTPAPFGHSNHDERLHSGCERYEETGGGKGLEYSAGEEENGVKIQWVRMGTYDFREFFVT
jgi:hypothetical protein